MGTLNRKQGLTAALTVIALVVGPICPRALAFQLDPSQLEEFRDPLQKLIDEILKFHDDCVDQSGKSGDPVQPNKPKTTSVDDQLFYNEWNNLVAVIGTFRKAFLSKKFSYIQDFMSEKLPAIWDLLKAYTEGGEYRIRSKGHYYLSNRENNVRDFEPGKKKFRNPDECGPKVPILLELPEWEKFHVPARPVSGPDRRIRIELPELPKISPRYLISERMLVTVGTAGALTTITALAAKAYPNLVKGAAPYAAVLSFLAFSPLAADENDIQLPQYLHDLGFVGGLVDAKTVQKVNSIFRQAGKKEVLDMVYDPARICSADRPITDYLLAERIRDILASENGVIDSLDAGYVPMEPDTQNFMQLFGLEEPWNEAMSALEEARYYIQYDGLSKMKQATFPLYKALRRPLGSPEEMAVRAENWARRLRDEKFVDKLTKCFELATHP